MIWTPSQRQSTTPKSITPSSVSQYLNLKQIKLPIKNAGLRLSSHAFDLMNRFIELLFKQMPPNSVWPCCHERLQECIIDLDLLPEARNAYLASEYLVQRGMKEESAQGFVRCVNRIVDLILAVTISLVESRGQSTVRQADMMQVLRKVPVLEPMRAEVLKLESSLVPEEKENLPTSPITPGAGMQTPTPKTFTAPPISISNAKPANLSDVNVQTVVCLDTWLPWCKTQAQGPGVNLSSHLVSSVGVETEDYDVTLDQRAILSAHLQGLIDRIVQLK